MKKTILDKARKSIKTLYKIEELGFNKDFKNVYLALVTEFNQCVDDAEFTRLVRHLINKDNSETDLNDIYGYDGYPGLDRFYEGYESLDYKHHNELREMVTEIISRETWAYISNL